MSVLGIAGLQLELGESGNLGLIEKELRKLRRRFGWVRMALLSELAVHGANPANAEEEGGPTERHFCALARELDLWLIPGSFFQRRGNKVFNVAPVIDNRGQVVARYAKIFPFYPYEDGVAPGDTPVVFDMPGVGRIGLSICYDMWFPETTRSLAAMGAEVVLHPSLTNTIDRDVELSIARTNAAINQCFFVDVNGGGALGNGRSGAYGPGGTILYQAGSSHEVLAFELDLAEVRRARTRGWQGLGQVLKSYRDSVFEFPLSAVESRRSPALEALGPLGKPERQEPNLAPDE